MEDFIDVLTDFIERAEAKQDYQGSIIKIVAMPGSENIAPTNTFITMDTLKEVLKVLIAATRQS